MARGVRICRIRVGVRLLMRGSRRGSAGRMLRLSVLRREIRGRLGRGRGRGSFPLGRRLLRGGQVLLTVRVRVRVTATVKVAVTVTVTVTVTAKARARIQTRQSILDYPPASTRCSVLPTHHIRRSPRQLSQPSHLQVHRQPSHRHLQGQATRLQPSHLRVSHLQAQARRT